MKIRYCWRCRTDVPMLDSEEGKIASKLLAEGFQEARKQMKSLTGYEETNQCYHAPFYRYVLTRL